EVSFVHSQRGGGHVAVPSRSVRFDRSSDESNSAAQTRKCAAGGLNEPAAVSGYESGSSFTRAVGRRESARQNIRGAVVLLPTERGFVRGQTDTKPPSPNRMAASHLRGGALLLAAALSELLVDAKRVS